MMKQMRKGLQPVELMQLRYFKEAARLENISRAAESLHITQSALSKSITKLESEIGVSLFEREGNRIHLNHFGKALLRSADQVMVSLESGLAQVRDLAGLESGTIRVGVSADVFIKHLVKEFLLSHPNVSMTCLLQSNEQMVNSLEAGTMDFTISTDPLDGNDLVWQPLYQDHLTAMLSHNHPLASRKLIYLEELAEERFIITNMGYGMRSSTYALCRQAGFEPKVLYEGYDTEMAGALVNEGIAVMITPHSITMGVQRFEMHQPPNPPARIPLGDSFVNKTIGINVKRGHYQSAAAMEFYTHVTNYFSAL